MTDKSAKPAGLDPEATSPENCQKIRLKFIADSGSTLLVVYFHEPHECDGVVSSYSTHDDKVLATLAWDGDTDDEEPSEFVLCDMESLIEAYNAWKAEQTV